MCSRRVGDKRKICFGPNWAYHKITYDLIGSFKKKKDLHGPFQQIMKNPTAYDLFSMLMWWIHVKTCVSGVWQVHPRKKWSGLTPLRESIMKFRGRRGGVGSYRILVSPWRERNSNNQGDLCDHIYCHENCPSNQITKPTENQSRFSKLELSNNDYPLN